MTHLKIELFWKGILVFNFCLIRLIATELIEYEEENKPCRFSETIKIANGSRNHNKIIVHDDIKYHPVIYANYDYIMINLTHKQPAENHTRGCICKLKNCVRFCGNKTNPEIYLPFEGKSAEVIDVMANDFHVITGKPCEDVYPFDPEDGKIEMHKVRGFLVSTSSILVEILYFSRMES